MPRSSMKAFPRAWATREDDPDGGGGVGETPGEDGGGEETVGGEATVGDGAFVGGVELDGEGASTEGVGEGMGEVEGLDAGGGEVEVTEGGGAAAVAAVTVTPNAMIGQCPGTPQINQ